MENGAVYPLTRLWRLANCIDGRLVHWRGDRLAILPLRVSMDVIDEIWRYPIKSMSGEPLQTTR